MSIGQRVNITTAAKLTGRAEKTIRAWLAEDPSPLSVEMGAWRGGRRLAASARVKKGRTRLLDVDELRALHEARGGTAWYAQYLPAPALTDVHLLAEAVSRLEGRVAAIEGELRELEALRRQPLPALPSSTRYEPGARIPATTRPLPIVPVMSSPTRDRSSSSWKPRKQQVDTLPPGWHAFSRICIGHNINQLAMQRVVERGHLAKVWTDAPKGEPWIHVGGKNRGYEIERACSPEQHVALCDYAAHAWPATFRPSCGDDCSYAALALAKQGWAAHTQD